MSICINIGNSLSLAGRLLYNIISAGRTKDDKAKDYEADERGELPPDLKRGVLSQDALYDLLERLNDEDADG